MPERVRTHVVCAVLDGMASQISLGENTVVFNQGDSPGGVYIVRNGCVRMTVRVEEKEVLLRLAQPGDVIGLSGVFGNQPYSLTATTIQETELGFVPAPEFVEAIRSNPALGLQILQLLSEDVRAARTAVANGGRVQ